MKRRSSAWLSCLSLAAVASATAADPVVRAVAPLRAVTLTSPAGQPAEYRYLAFPVVHRVSDDEIWVAYKAGRSHATDAGAAMEIVRHTLSSGRTTLVQRVPAPPPKPYQMGEFVRQPDGALELRIDVQDVGWDGRHYRSGAETLRWNAARGAFDPAVPMPPVEGVQYGYPFEFIVEGRTTWQLVMAFGYHQPGGRWSVDVLRSGDSGRSWSFVRNLTAEFGGIRGNESGFVRHGDGFLVTTRGYDRIARLHRTDGEFRVQRQADLTGKYPFVNNIIGRPRIFVRDGHGYLIGRNWTRPQDGSAGPSEMQLCLLRFDPATLALTGCVIIDNAEQRKLGDGYYAVPVFAGEGADTRLHVITYKGLPGQPPEIVRFDYRWADLK
mgnify:CR=1 FL=1